ncbi:MAG: hypothetical protein WCC26_03900 [Terracidiphilus sp.]
MWLFAFALVLGCALTVTAAGQTPLDVQAIRPGGTTGTCEYKANGPEKPYLSNVSKGETVNGSATDPYSIYGKTGKYVAWFGIVRGITAPAQKGGDVKVLVEHRFFDGMTDCQIMVVAENGGGDFEAHLRIDPSLIPPLALVRIYGVVMDEKNHMPQVFAEYMRLWPWRTFTFANFGPPNKSNPRWAQFATADGIPVYNSSPTEDYYRHMLGDPLEFGLSLKAEQPAAEAAGPKISANQPQ